MPLILIAFLSMGAVVPTRAQDPCGFGSQDGLDTWAKGLDGLQVVRRGSRQNA